MMQIQILFSFKILFSFNRGDGTKSNSIPPETRENGRRKTSREVWGCDECDEDEVSICLAEECVDICEGSTGKEMQHASYNNTSIMHFF